MLKCTFFATHLAYDGAQEFVQNKGVSVFPFLFVGNNSFLPLYLRRIYQVLSKSNCILLYEVFPHL